MWKKSVALESLVFFLASFLLLSCTARADLKIEETTVNYEDTTVEVTIYGDVELTKVKPQVKIEKGKKKGRLSVEVELKNTGVKPDRYYVFASGIYKEGISAGGNVNIPEEGFLEPGETAGRKIKTEYKGKGLPSTITLEIYSFEGLGHEPDLLEILAPE